MKYFLARLYQKILYIFTCLIKFREPIILNNTDELVNVFKIFYYYLEKEFVNKNSILT